MCLIAIALHHHHDYPLVVAANRDEFYERPTAPLAFWEDHPQILGGRDLQSKGTWLAVNTAGRIAAVTNYRAPETLHQKPGGPSRGRLVTDFLTSSTPPADYLEEVRAARERYNGFNLLVGNIHELWWYANPADAMEKLSPGIHGLSNHLLNTPWPKVDKSKARLSEILAGSGPVWPERIFEMLADQQRPRDRDLPRTGIALEWERTLSPIFIQSPGYGTRSSSIILVDTQGKLIFMERTFALDDFLSGPPATRRFELDTPAFSPATAAKGVNE
jgi:uncharacterized protein with NRDE domain